MKILVIVGARPQFIKAATISRAIALHDEVVEVIVHTGQHYDANMSDIFFKQLEMPEPDYNLGIGGGLHGAMTGRQLEQIEKVLVSEQPDWVLVYGDTNSTLAGALAAAKLQIPVAHVEAGLRSFDRRMPEEINRVLTDHISTLLFAPTSTSKKNLIAEGIEERKIHLVGDVMYDATLHYKERAARPEWFDGLGLTDGEYVLCTVHRQENTDNDQRLRDIFQGLTDSGLPIILPLHPRTRARMVHAGIEPGMNLHLVDPVGYLEMVWLESNCRSVATDSGGVQKEAYFHAKPCVTLRNETEWVELVQLGCNRLVGSEADQISSALLSSDTFSPTNGLYGQGNSANLIVKVLRQAAG